MKAVRINEVRWNKIICEDTETLEPYYLIVDEEIAKAFQQRLSDQIKLGNDLIVELSSQEFDYSTFDRFLLKKMAFYQKGVVTDIEQEAVKLLIETRRQFIELVDKTAKDEKKIFSGNLQDGDLIDERDY